MAKRKKTQTEETHPTETPLEPVLSVEATAETVEPKFDPQPDPITEKYLALAEACRKLPPARIIPTDRWYGEEFLPQYEKATRQIKALLE
jgi:hypothetical protein